MKFKLTEEKLNILQDGEINPDGSVTIRYIHLRNTNTINYGTTYGQNLEPAGEYMSFIDNFDNINKNLTADYGIITFHHPLILEHKNTNDTGWKKDLSDMFDGKTGKKLSKAIMSKGYDGILTWGIFRGKKSWSEIVNLCGEKIAIE